MDFGWGSARKGTARKIVGARPCTRPPVRKIMKEELRQLGSGVYVDEKGMLHLKMGEFLAAHHLTDSPEVRRAVVAEVRLQFGNVPVQEME